MAVKRFDELDFGDEVETRPDVGMERVTLFAEATGMKVGRFLDHEAARKEGLPSAIVPGVMSQGLLTAAVHSWISDAVIESIDTIFRAPLQVDSTPTCRITVTDRDEDTGAVELDLVVVNEANETRVLGTAKVRPRVDASG
ncbi:MAG: MaoC/PaaZ C-terminal domain-containing protein [Acidimicrobiia bacterium]|nr:MaoC/PaaZ C-terminal domain-containing protein [Acidimicrobiia bacterium]